MNITSRPVSKITGFMARLLYISASVCALGVTSMPAYGATTAVTVDPTPLIIQASLPPNITLMLDDSGSMTWDYMPDWGYLTDTSNDGVRNAAVNGTYYNPSVTYTVPPKADGSFYPTPGGITSAYKDGFASTGLTNITQYTGGDNNANGSGANTFPEYTVFPVTITTNYAATVTYSCSLGYTGPDASHNCKQVLTGKIVAATITYSCNSGDSRSGTTCTNSVTVNKYFFTYTTGSSNTQHYIGVTGDCSYLTTAQQAVCDNSTASQTNVAIWFSFYRTRILMAKSGLMNSFSSVNANYRVGFGSINGNNDGSLPNSTGIGSTGYNVAPVAPFGDGSSNTQKAKFWTWVSGESANGGTPLRSALDAVGQYYQTAQPWTTMSTDPNPTGNANTELACRQSYTILTTDGFWNDSYTGPGDADGTVGPTNTSPNGQTLAYNVAFPYADGGTIGNTTTTAICPSRYSLSKQSNGLYQCVRSGQTNQTPTCSGTATLSANQSQCISGTVKPSVSYSNTLADVAMKYWETDLRGTTINEVPPSTEDPAFWQHMTTFTLGLGFTPTGISPSGTTVDQVFTWANGGAAISGFSWPQPASNSINNIADLAHAAVNGHGGFYSATSPDAFTSGLQDALKRASERVGTGASLSANSTQLQSGTFAYQANYYTAKWKGDLKALVVDSTSGAIATTATWTASTVLPAAVNRTIYSYNPAAKTYLAFKLGASNALPALSTSQLSALGSSAATQANMINYLRGDQSMEQSVAGGIYRNRDTPLGDIIDSQPVYSGAPDPNQFTNESFTGLSTFAQYASDKSLRTALLYVAANDGMMHAFNATTGVEVYSYLPGAVITSGLTDLANPSYGDTITHEYFNDGEMTVADAYIGGAWKTILVGTTGRGLAKAVYALDVTDPANIAFLWERSASDGLANSNYIGQMVGKPVIAQTADSSWSVMIGNGYNSAAAKSALLQFNLADGTLSALATTDTSGLAAPGVWMNPAGNGISTIAYAGDANGNVWSFSFNTPTTTAGAPIKLFTAKDGSNNPQPITAGMLTGKDAQTGNVWIFFGTGKYLASTDLTDTSVQTWYGLVVQSATANNPAVGAATTMSRTALASRSITAETAATTPTPPTPPTLAERTITTAAAASSMTNMSGWYIDLTSPIAATPEGERMVTPNQFQGNLLLGTTRIPQATDACNPSGRGWIMAVDPFTGTNPSTGFFDTNGDGSVNSSDMLNGTPVAAIGFNSLPNNPIFVGSSMLTSFDNGTTSSLMTSSSTGNMQRVSWRELINQ